MINVKDIENFSERGVDQSNLVVLVEYFSNKLTELKIIVRNTSKNYETYTDLAMVYYYIINLRAFAKERINIIEECEKDWFSCLYFAWELEVFYNQLGLLITEFKRNFNVS